MRWWALLVAASLLTAACSAGASPPSTESADGSVELLGVFGVTEGQCSDAGVTSGSYFRMVQPGGDLASGPYVPNADSPCGDATWLPLPPGRDGGLITGAFQPFPEPAFDDGGNGLADRIALPTTWFAVAFSLASNPVDPQTDEDTVPPSIVHDGAGGLTGDLRAIAAAWNGQFFNQGSPKPDGSLPGSTRPVSGSYDATTGAYTLEWSTQIVGGAFDTFTGIWHLEGVFEAAG